MQIEEGKFYWTRSGSKVGPIHLFDGGPHYDVKHPSAHADVLWNGDGTAVGSDAGKQDIIAEWHDVTVVEGKRYRTADGETIGPMKKRDGEFFLAAGDPSERIWDIRGRRCNLGNPHNWIVAEAAAATREFAVGDRVRCVDGGAGRDHVKGKIGTITKLNNSEAYAYITWDGLTSGHGPGSSNWNVHFPHLELVEAGTPRRFKVGDRVRVSTARFSNQKGQVGTVAEVDERDDMPVWVNFDGVQPGGEAPYRVRNCYEHDDLEPWGEPEKKPEPEPVRQFKPGDRIVSVSDVGQDIDIGDIFVVIGVDDDVVIFKDRAGDRRERAARQYRLADAQGGAITKGTRVRCTDGGGDRYDVKDRVGIVLSLDPFGTMALVKFDDLTTGHGDANSCWNVEVRFLELIQAAPKAAGSTVLVITEGKNYRLRNGVLVGPIETDDNDPYVWKAWQEVSEDADTSWTASGVFLEGEPDSPHDIVAEWIGDIPALKTGDLVVNISDLEDGLTIGREYVLTHAYGDGDIEFTDDDGEERMRRGCRYRLAGQPLDQPEHAQAEQPAEPEGPPEFAAGDLIRSVSDTSDDIAPGDTFTATGIEEDPAGWLVSFTHPQSGERSRYASRYERVAS